MAKASASILKLAPSLVAAKVNRPGQIQALDGFELSTHGQPLSGWLSNAQFFHSSMGSENAEGISVKNKMDMEAMIRKQLVLLVMRNSVSVPFASTFMSFNFGSYLSKSYCQHCQSKKKKTPNGAFSLESLDQAAWLN